jgi:hypothetical protein
MGEVKLKRKIVVQQNPPSIPYRDSAYGYEPMDKEGKLLINVGNTYRHS